MNKILCLLKRRCRKIRWMQCVVKNALDTYNQPPLLLELHSVVVHSDFKPL